MQKDDDKKGRVVKIAKIPNKQKKKETKIKNKKKNSTF